MPRKRKDQQAPAAAPGQPYGENIDQLQAQAVIPLPQQQPPVAGGNPTGPPPTQEGDPMANLLALAQGTPPPAGGLFGPTQRPIEPITTGLPVGPGAGPEAIVQDRARMRTVADTFSMLADVTGSPMYRRLAQQAQAQGA